MKITRQLLLLAFIVFGSCKEHQNLQYPFLEIQEEVDIYHGIQVRDPYRNLENLEDSIVQKWFNKNAILTDSVFEAIENKDFFYQRLKSDEETKEMPIYITKLLPNGEFFYLQKINDNSEGIFYRDVNNNEKLLFNSSDFLENSQITYFKESWDYKKIAICISIKGEDKSQIVIYDIENNELLDDIIDNAAVAVAGTIEWLHNNSGFTYVRVPHFNYEDSTYLQNTEARLHIIGQPISNEVIVLSKENNPELQLSVGDIPRIEIPNKNSDYVFSWGGNVSNYNSTYFTKSNDFVIRKPKWEPLFSENEKISQFFIENKWLYFRTSKNTPNFKINRISLDKRNDFENAETLVSEIKDEVIVDFTVVSNEIYFTTLKNGVESKFYKYTFDKGLIEISLPISSGSCYLERTGDNIKLTLEGWTQATSLYLFDIKTQTFQNKSLQKKYANEYDDLKVEEIEVASYDGTMIPLSLIHRKDLTKDKRNRTILLSYGSYGAVTSAVFSELLLVWLEKGDIIAVPHVRGGGEKGDDWHKGGYKSTKSNTWKDFIACTEFLIDEGYTSPKYTIAFGNSAGGIPAGRSITERPDLFAASIMTAPALNMVRCEFQPNGENNIPEFGTVKDSIEFRALMKMDSYHNLDDKKQYPAVLIQVGMNDGIVTPWDPGKFIARLQNLTSSYKPALLDVKFEGNHSGGGTMDETYKDFSRLYSFALWQTGHPEFQP